MPYLIDGHNLIPKIASLRLGDIDDEAQLVEMLQEFCRLKRKQVEVYFDRRGVGQPPARNFGSVIARFVREGATADQAIAHRLSRLGRSARNWTVVSSDRSVQAAARAAQARVISSQAFSLELAQALSVGNEEFEKDAEKGLDTDELQDWLDVFGGE